MINLNEIWDKIVEQYNEYNMKTSNGQKIIKYGIRIIRIPENSTARCVGV